MKNIRFLTFALAIATVFLSACGGAAATPATSAGGGNVEPIPVTFIGTVDSIAGDQWVINGQTVTVSPDVIRDGSFNVGDQVKVEGLVNADGSFTVSRVEVPTPQDSSSLPQFGNENSNDSNTNDANSNDVNSNDANTNDDNSNDVNSNDDNGNDANSNDDNGNDSNSNDDNGNDTNSNDDNGNDNSDDGNGNDDNSGGGNDNGGGNDDNGSGDNEDNSND
jgi:hypothetical protein